MRESPLNCITWWIRRNLAPDAANAERVLDEARLNDRSSSGSLNGFTRIAAQVHHALEKYRARIAIGSRSETLVCRFHGTDDLSYLPGLPRTPDPSEARAYIERVARELDAHRASQRPL